MFIECDLFKTIPSSLTSRRPFAGIQSVAPVTTFPSVSAATGQQTYAAPYPASSSAPPIDKPTTQANASRPTSSAVILNHQPYGTSTQFMYPQTTGSYSYTQFAPYSGTTPYGAVGQTPYSQGYHGASVAMASASQPLAQYSQYGYGQPYMHPQFRGGQLHWQQPYQGPLVQPFMVGPQVQHGPRPIQPSQSTEPSQPSPVMQPLVDSNGAASVHQSHYRDHVQQRQPNHQPRSQPPLPSKASTDQKPALTTPQPGSTVASTSADPDTVSVPHVSQAQSVLDLPPAQLTELLRANPQLRDMMQAAIGQSQAAQVLA